MRLFDWLAGKKDKVEIAKYRIWLTHQAKIAGIQKEVAQVVGNPATPGAVIVVAHFNDCLEQLQAAVAGFDKDRVFVTSANLLAGRTPTDFAADESTCVLIVMGERHPLQSHDDVVLEFARSKPGRCLLVYHVSLEDPLLKRFTGEWVERVLRSLGMKEDEPIESRMVIRRIDTELKKIATNATGDAPANSAGEWLERNYR
jgi:hypothetical protein